MYVRRVDELTLPLARGIIESNVSARARSDFARSLIGVESVVRVLATPRGYVRFDTVSFSSEGDLDFLRNGTGAYLGCDAEGIHYVVRFGEGDGSMIALRESAGELSATQLAAAVPAAALAAWHATARFCERCGGPLENANMGWMKRCSECRVDVYPRTDPAMIVAVFDADGRLLLAHNTAWTAGRVSLLAGYVDAGEAPERTVIREVAEEVGIRTAARPKFLGTSPWPFPRSLMLTYRLDLPLSGAEADAALLPDECEIAWARFYTRQQLRDAIADGTVSTPSASSVAARVIERWLEGCEI